MAYQINISARLIHSLLDSLIDTSVDKIEHINLPLIDNTPRRRRYHPCAPQGENFSSLYLKAARYEWRASHTHPPP